MELTNADILIFGASEANHHYVSTVFEDSLKMSCYNTGREANGILFHTAILRSVLERYTPKIVILDNSSNFEIKQNDYDRLSSLLPYYRTHKEIRDIIELRSPFERIKLLSEIYPFNSQILTISIGNLEINKSREIEEKGYVPFYGEWNSKIDSVYINTNYELDINKLNKFREFIELSKKSGIKIYIIRSPVFQIFNNKYESEMCEDMCNSERVPYWDFSQDTLFLSNNNLFFEIGYLNHKGAIVFSKLVVDKIKQDLRKQTL
jgi:hypothetical protein